MATTNGVTPDEPDFDFIIVGGGTAGCVVANRLSEDPDVNVLLLEAGQNRNSDPRIFTPRHGRQLLGNDEFDWQYESEPQAGLNGRVIPQPRGKVLGGSSAINSFALIYPSVAGMNAWADLGNKGWEWENVAPYFRKFQTLNMPDDAVVEKLGAEHFYPDLEGSNGPVQASYPRVAHFRQKAWVEAFKELGLSNTTDPLEGNAVGGHIPTSHISHDQGERSHAGNAYFEPASSRPNLRLITGALVKQILFDRTGGKEMRATRVSYICNDKTYSANCKKEVILAAGAFASPQLLELSGIGSPEHLRKHNIEVLYSNPAVGENLQDHIRCGISFEAKKTEPDNKPTQTPESAQKQYDETRSGPLADAACYTFAYLPLTPLISPEERLFLTESLNAYLATSTTLSPFEQQRNAFIHQTLTSPTEAMATGYLASKPADLTSSGAFLTFFAMLAHPFSRGSVHISSASITDKPAIDFAYYSSPLDLQILILYLRFYQRLAQTPQFANLINTDGLRLPPAGDGDTVEKMQEWLRKASGTNYHACGTCAMLPESIGGVVDERLRVYGTRNVRVVDASVFPIIPRGNIISTVYAVAEKAADIVSEEFGVRRTS